ncbi:uncharacterized protein LY89DRAFT_677179 [Mollisia scopiformis]|uniref:MAPEG family protein n=1 Tax=Mollisia scopiformis TaxID=149040 RepID=A0A132B8J0_MOLSC|nr:uncharacterized protein LY89DRAFT_677179 [Mollisia scopiformis]KUJ08309.1 hypothetical protein LY89DRAFT_677179 [Mollisia scopiformis]
MSTPSLFDGVVNSNGILMIAFGPIFLAFIPVTNYITTPNSLVQKAIETLLAAIPGSASIPSNRVIPALSAFYIFWTFAATGAASAAGLGASRKEGLDNSHPRKDISALRGLPLRLRSAHYNTMEMFPIKGFALAAALAQITAPTNQNLINLLGLHVLLKTFIYYPAYILDIAPLRSLAHLGATASVINVAWQVATGAK